MFQLLNIHILLIPKIMESKLNKILKLCVKYKYYSWKDSIMFALSKFDSIFAHVFKQARMVE